MVGCIQPAPASPEGKPGAACRAVENWVPFRIHQHTFSPTKGRRTCKYTDFRRVDKSSAIHHSRGHWWIALRLSTLKPVQTAYQYLLNP